MIPAVNPPPQAHGAIYVAVAGGTFDPATMFSGSKPGIFYDTATLSSLFEDRSATPSTPASVNGVVGTRKDLSGNANHQIAISDAARPILRNSGGLYWLEYDTVDDMFASGSVATVGATGAFFHGMSVLDSVGSVLFFQTSGGNPFIGVLQSGSGSGGASVSVGSYNVDGSSVGATRGDLFTAIASASGVTPHLFEARSADVSTFGSVSAGAYSGFPGLARGYATLLISETDLGVNQAALRTWFGQRMGLIL